jgi:hypothetical protein
MAAEDSEAGRAPREVLVVDVSVSALSQTLLVDVIDEYKKI